MVCHDGIADAPGVRGSHGTGGHSASGRSSISCLNSKPNSDGHVVELQPELAVTRGCQLPPAIEPLQSDGCHEAEVDDEEVQGSIASCRARANLFDPKNDIILRLESMEENELKKILVVIKIGVWAGFVVLCALFTLKFRRANSWFADRRNVPLLNVVIASVCIPVLIISIVLSVRNMMWAHRCQKRWSHRRKVPTILFFLLLCVQFANTVVYLISNTYILASKCRWNDELVVWCGFVQWALCWGVLFALLAVHAHNAVPLPPRKDGSIIRTPAGFEAMVLDMPILKYHWPKLVYLAVHIGIQVSVGVHLRHYRGKGHLAGSFARFNCGDGILECKLDTVTLVLATLSILTLNGSLLWWLAYVLIAARKLKQWSYYQQRNGNLNLRFQIRFLRYTVIFFAFSSILLFFVKINSCSSFIETWLGFSPMFIVMTVTCVCMTYIYQPKQTERNAAMDLALMQSFAWTEKYKAEKVRLRNEVGPRCERLRKAPMFCVETAIKLLYFSSLCYSIQEAGKSDTQNITRACQMYELQQHELLREKQEDSKALLAWNDHRLVVAFRGTASWSNVTADLQMWLRSHPKSHSSFNWRTNPIKWLNRPMVHAGFYRSWTVSGFSIKVMDRVRQIVDSRRAGARFHVYLTGHSLGGAIATMAAVDIAKQICEPQPDVSISVYTFGAPRTGNHSFAKLYDSLAPDTWSVINDQDLVARGGKFWKLYKRPALRVLIDNAGTMLVRPAFVEISLRRTGRAKARDHHLRAYRAAMLAVLSAQFERGKAFHDGMKGVILLAHRIPVQEVFASKVNIQTPDTDTESGQPPTNTSTSDTAVMSLAKIPSPYKNAKSVENPAQHLSDRLTAAAVHMGGPRAGQADQDADLEAGREC